MNLHEIYLAAQLAGKNSGGNSDLTDYYTKSQTDSLISGKVDKVSGKGLSQNSFTDDEKAKLAGLENYDDAEIKNGNALVLQTIGYTSKNLCKPIQSQTITKNGLTITVSNTHVSVSGTPTGAFTTVLTANTFTAPEDIIIKGASQIQNAIYACKYVNADTGANSYQAINGIDRTIKSGSTISELYFQIATENIGKEVSAEIDIMGAYTSVYDGTVYPYKPSVAEHITETTEQTALNRSTLGYQRKNLLKNTADSITTQGLTYKVDSDGTITVNGTATTDAVFKIGDISVSEDTEFILSGCPKNGGWNSFLLYCRNNAGYINPSDDTGNGRNITINGDFGVYIRTKEGYTHNNTIFKPMVRYSVVTDNIYEPYKPSVAEHITETTEQTALNRSTLGYQRKNLLKNTSSSVTKYGLTYTNNADGSVTVNGEATQNVIHKIGSISVNGESSFILSGTAAGSSSAGYNLQCRRNNATIARDLGNGTMITASEDFDVAIYIFGGTVCDNIMFCPMLRYADITDNTYEPYKPSVEERLTALENAILGGNYND